MLRNISIFLLMMALTLTLVSCSNDSAQPPSGGGDVAVGDLDPAGTGFEIELEFAAGPDSLHRGPFLLKGSPPVWAAVWEALVVEFTVTNLSEVSQLEPVSLEFTRLIPDSTELLVEFDVDGKYLFEFANDDLWWTPGEESLPKRILFSAEQGQSVGFNARIGVGGQLDAWISGYVWHDLNRDGIIQIDEAGLEGVPLGLDDGGPQEIIHRAVTDANGWFAFRGLPRATYEVIVLDMPYGYEPTTPPSMHILLTPPMGGGDGFADANFGYAAAKPR